MAVYKLTYFNVKALGEPVRYLLSYMGKTFNDHRLQGDDWLNLKKNMPFGKLPILEIDGQVYHQSAAICRFLAHEAGLSGRTPIENLKIDQLVGAFNDLTYQVGTMFNTKDEALKENLKQILVKETIPFYMERFEKVLEDNGGYLLKQKLSWGDLYVVAYSETVPGIFGFDLADAYPHFGKLKSKVQLLPGISQWIERRPETPL